MEAGLVLRKKLDASKMSSSAFPDTCQVGANSISNMHFLSTRATLRCFLGDFLFLAEAISEMTFLMNGSMGSDTEEFVLLQ